MKRWIQYTCLSIFLIILWQVLSTQYSTMRLLVSSPILVFQYLLDNHSSLFDAVVVTFTEAALGLLIAVFVGFLVMVCCFYRPGLLKFLMPLMITSQVIPLVVLAPFFIILLGVGITSKIAMAALISFFPVFINFSQGYSSISKNIHELMFINNAPLFYRIKRIYFPLSMPSIMAGLKISATLASIGAIVAEFTGSESGLGRNLFLSAIRLEPEMMISSLILSAAIGGVLYKTICFVERRLGKWYL